MVQLMTLLLGATNDYVIRNLAIGILLLCFLIGLILSLSSAIIIFIAYILGILLSLFLIKSELRTRYCLQKLLSIFKDHFYNSNVDQDNVCTICNGPACIRHKKCSRLPWKNIYINKELNKNIENFFDHIIDEFILAWYVNYTNDKSFIYELKHSIRYAAGAVIKRFLELDIGHIIANKLLPCYIKHVDDYLCMAQIAELKNCDINKIACDYMGKQMHIATSCRSNELKYLQYLATALTERLLPAENLKCKNFTILLREILSGWILLPVMDVLADPHIINELLILSITYKSKMPPLQLSTDEKVEFLCNYGVADFKEVALAMDLRSIIKDPANLYNFMQYLKKEGVVHLLQFYLNIEDFNGNLLKPDLAKRQLEELHSEALMLYKDYIDPKSDTFIGCSDEIIKELRELLDEGVYSVAKLQTAEPLYKASEFTFNLLENEWLPSFYHSIEFYMLVGGNKVENNYTKNASASSPFIAGSPIRFRQKRFDNQGTVAKLSNSLGKIKCALQTKPVEGSIYPPESRIMENDAAFVEDFPESTNRRNLSTWRISIPAVESHQCAAKTIYDFNIEVQRTEALTVGENRHWTVKRRDQDFYTLKSKLIEFHGENEICYSPLPTRRNTLSLDARKLKYEEFLKSLLEKPMLKGSDLLHTFLTSPQDFTLLLTTSLPIVDLENIYQSVTSKLRKEKGQHLDTFLINFFSSTGRPKSPKLEYGVEIDSNNKSSQSTLPQYFTAKIFEDNYGIVYKRDDNGSSSTVNPTGITDSLFYLLKHIFRVPDPALKLYVAICMVAKHAVETVSRVFIEKKLRSMLNEQTLALLIKELDEVVFGKFVPSTKEERQLRKEKAFHLLEEAIPSITSLLLGTDFKSGIIKLFEIFQNPLYNKQLAYNLVDILLGEMYPELDTSDEFY